METRADVQHNMTMLRDSFSSILQQLDDLFDKLWTLNRLPAGSWGETEKRLLCKCNRRSGVNEKPFESSPALEFSSPLGAELSPPDDEIIEVKPKRKYVKKISKKDNDTPASHTVDV